MDDEKLLLKESTSTAIDSQRQEQIRERAYELYLARIRNGEPGDAMHDWLHAEAEIILEVDSLKRVGTRNTMMAVVEYDCSTSGLLGR